MPKSQEDYSYEEYLKYLKISKTALKSFDKKYTDLSFSHIHPKQIVLSMLKDFVAQYEELFISETQYLEPEEQNTVVIGSVHRVRQDDRYARQEKMVEKAKDRFKLDLDRMVSIGQTNITAQLLGLQGLSADFTSRRMKKRVWHVGWVEKQENYYRNYHVKLAKQFSASKDLDLEFAGRPNDLPEESGIYFLFKDGEIVYIGKSSNLKNRLSNQDIVRKCY